MKELDVLLESFVAENEADLRNGAWPDLERFLSLEDDRLWDCMRQTDTFLEPEYKALIKAIRDAPGAAN